MGFGECGLRSMQQQPSWIWLKCTLTKRGVSDNREVPLREIFLVRERRRTERIYCDSRCSLRLRIGAPAVEYYEWWSTWLSRTVLIGFADDLTVVVVTKTPRICNFMEVKPIMTSKGGCNWLNWGNDRCEVEPEGAAGLRAKKGRKG